MEILLRAQKILAKEKKRDCREKKTQYKKLIKLHEIFANVT